MRARFVNKTGPFMRNTDAAIDRALGHMAMDVETLAKSKVPVSNTKASGNSRGGGGHLQSAIQHRRTGNKKFEVVANKEYARYQEYGGDGKRTVRKYSTPGTGKRYLRDAGEKVSSKMMLYLKGQIKLVRG